jgi:hypothetical protein
MCRMWVTQGVSNERHSPLVSFEYLRLVSVNSVFSVVNTLPRAWPQASWLSCPKVQISERSARAPSAVLDGFVYRQVYS